MTDLFPVDSVAQPQTMLLAGRSVDYVLKRTRRRRSIAFSVDGDGLVVSAPWNASDSRIQRSIAEAANWIVRKLDEWSGYETRKQRWADGEQIEYLGRPLMIKVVADAVLVPPVLLDEWYLQITVADPDGEKRIHEAAVAWYRRHASRNFTDRIARYATQMGLAAPQLCLSAAQTQWGSCNSKGQIRLNWRLIQAPQDVIDYVVVHELAHLFEMNHSKRFWHIVARHFPGHLRARKHLDKRGHWYLAI